MVKGYGASNVNWSKYATPYTCNMAVFKNTPNAHITVIHVYCPSDQDLAKVFT